MTAKCTGIMTFSGTKKSPVRRLFLAVSLARGALGVLCRRLFTIMGVFGPFHVAGLAVQAGLRAGLVLGGSWGSGDTMTCHPALQGRVGVAGRA